MIGNMSNSIIKNDDRHANKPALIHAKTHADPDDLWISLFPTLMLKSLRKLHGKNIKLNSPAGKEWSKKMHITDGLSQEWRRKHTMAIPENMGKLLALPLILKCMAIIISIASQLWWMTWTRPF